MKSLIGICFSIMLACIAGVQVVDAQRNLAWKDADGHQRFSYRSVQIDGRTVKLHGIDIPANFPSDSIAMEEAFHFIKSHFFNAVRVTTPQPELFYTLCERYRLRVFDADSLVPFPWIWQAEMSNARMVRENFSPISIEDINSESEFYQFAVTNDYGCTLPRGVVFVYKVESRLGEENIDGEISLEGILDGGSKVITLPVKRKSNIWTISISIVVTEPFDGFRVGDRFVARKIAFT